MSTPAQQKALVLQEKGGQFALINREVPTPTRGSLLIKNESIGLNPVNWKIQQLGLFIPEYPAVVGLEAAGTVHTVGEGVTDFEKGDRVLYKASFGNDEAPYQQWWNSSLMQRASKLPDGISFDAAATVPTALATSAVALYSQPGGPQYTSPWAEGGRGKYAGQPLVITGGATVVGSAAIQLGKLSGFSPIITTASLKNAALLQSYGATHVLNRNLSADALRAETQAVAYGLLAPGGKLVVILPPSVKETTEGRTITGLATGVRLQQDPQFAEGLFKAIPALLQSGEIKPLNVEVVPGGLAGIVSGLLKKNQVSAAKLIVHPQETA
ncbi:GroES-like protein [Dichomitus squalens]|uniref:GroES-like protein n=1 Tax=Dichomitus squalens TaxID=114155 RepID=A0A4Q9MSF2_9APHY|nr:GroES-like protein [Dichomitus squalens]